MRTPPVFTGRLSWSTRLGKLYARVYALVSLIPPGRVATYGEVACEAGCGPRQVGYALRALGPSSGVPWHRVVGAGGRITLSDGSGPSPEQVVRLRAEGVEVTDSGRIDLSRFAWTNNPNGPNGDGD